MVTVNLDDYPMEGTVHITNGSGASYYKDLNDPSTKYANFQCGTKTLTGNNIAADMQDAKYLDIARTRFCPTCFDKQSEKDDFIGHHPDFAPQQ